MTSFAVQGFTPNDLPVSCTTSASCSIRASNQTSGATSFSQALDRASAEQNCTDGQGNAVNARSTVDGNRTQKGDEQATPACRADGAQKKEQTDQNSTVGTQSASQTADAASSAAAQQADGSQHTTGSTQAPTNELTVTISLTDTGDGVNVSLQGLPEELLNALLTACSKGTGAAQAIASATANQADASGSDESGLESLSGGSAKQASSSDGNAKLTVKLPFDPSDVQDSVNQILSMLQALVGALQKNASNTVDLQNGQPQIDDPKACGSQASNLLAQWLLNGTRSNGTSANQDTNTVFRNFIAELSSQNVTTTTATDASTGLSAIPDSLSELKLPKGTDVTESLLAKVKSAVSLPGVMQPTNEAVEKETGSPSEGNGNSSSAEQSAYVPVSAQHQEPPAEISTSASFGSIVADRLAAVAEQVGVRERPLDILLRLKTEGGESLMVGLKDQAGKIVVQVRSADQNMVGFLESQKATIVRNLEAKQVSSSISVSPVEEDVTKRQGREQPKNMWERRREPANPYIETSV